MIRMVDVRPPCLALRILQIAIGQDFILGQAGDGCRYVSMRLLMIKVPGSGADVVAVTGIEQVGQAGKTVERSHDPEGFTVRVHVLPDEHGIAGIEQDRRDRVGHISLDFFPAALHGRLGHWLPEHCHGCRMFP